MPRKRRQFSPTQKAKVALEAIRSLKTIPDLAKQYQVHPTQISQWKQQLLASAETLFESGKKSKVTEEGPYSAELYEQIGKLNMQLEWLKKKWPNTVSEKRQWIDFAHPDLSVREQCCLLGLHRANLYYEPVPESAENLHLMRLMDEEYLRHPFYGSRRMVTFLATHGHTVNRKKVQRLMGKWAWSA